MPVGEQFCLRNSLARYFAQISRLLTRRHGCPRAPTVDANQQRQLCYGWRRAISLMAGCRSAGHQRLLAYRTSYDRLGAVQAGAVPGYAENSYCPKIRTSSFANAAKRCRMTCTDALPAIIPRHVFAAFIFTPVAHDVCWLGKSLPAGCHRVFAGRESPPQGTPTVAHEEAAEGIGVFGVPIEDEVSLAAKKPCSDGASASAECSVTIVARLPEITVPFFGQYALARSQSSRMETASPYRSRPQAVRGVDHLDHERRHARRPSSCGTVRPQTRIRVRGERHG